MTSTQPPTPTTSFQFLMIALAKTARGGLKVLEVKVSQGSFDKLVADLGLDSANPPASLDINGPRGPLKVTK